MSLLTIYRIMMPLEVFMKELRKALENRGYKIEVFDPLTGKLVAHRNRKLILGGLRNDETYVMDFNGFIGKECLYEQAKLKEALMKRGLHFKEISRELKIIDYSESWSSMDRKEVYLLGSDSPEIPGAKRMTSPCG